MSDNRIPTPEERRWQASVLDPQKAKRRIKYSYVVLGVWIAFSIAWLIVQLTSEEPFGWSNTTGVFVIIFGYFNVISGLIRNKRIAAGKKPLKFF